jgi:hypothetical protein
MSNDFWSITVLIGLMSWIVSTIVFALRGFPAKNIFVANASIYWGATSLISFIIFIIGLLNA